MKKKWYQILALLLIGAGLLMGCGKGGASGDETAAMASMDTKAVEAGEIASQNTAAPTENAKAESGGNSAGTQQTVNPNHKLIRRQAISMETKEFDKLTEFVQKQVEKAGGYIENSSISGTAIDTEGSRHANYSIRIPAAGLDNFVSVLKEKGNATYQTEEVEDVTLNYVDTESHISALKTEQETLMKMLEQSGELETVLAIQDRLTQVRYELESYESQLRIYDNEIEYSTVNLDISEVERETAADGGTFGSRLKERLSDNFYSLGHGLKNFALWFLGALPFWLMLAATAIVVVLIVKLIRRRIKKSGAKNDTQPDEPENNK